MGNLHLPFASCKFEQAPRKRGVCESGARCTLMFLRPKASDSFVTAIQHRCMTLWRGGKISKLGCWGLDAASVVFCLSFRRGARLFEPPNPQPLSRVPVGQAKSSE